MIFSFVFSDLQNVETFTPKIVMKTSTINLRRAPTSKNAFKSQIQLVHLKSNSTKSSFEIPPWLAPEFWKDIATPKTAKTFTQKDVTSWSAITPPRVKRSSIVWEQISIKILRKSSKVNESEKKTKKKQKNYRLEIILATRHQTLQI